MPKGVPSPKHVEVRSETRFQPYPPDYHISNPSSATEGPSQGLCPPSRGRDITGEASYPGPSRSMLPRLLQPRFLGSQESRDMEADHRPFQVKHLLECSSFQDGNHQVYSNGDTAQRLGGIDGFNGCVLTCTDPSRLSTLPSIPLRRKDVSIQGPAVRSGIGTPNFYDDSHSLRRSLSRDGVQAPSLPRRLATPLQIAGTTTATTSGSKAKSSFRRLDYQRNKVRIHTIPRLRLRWSSVPYGHRENAAPPRQDKENSSSRRRIQRKDSSSRKAMLEPFGTSEFGSRPNPPWPSIYASHPDVSNVSMETPQGPIRQVGIDTSIPTQERLELLGVGDSSPKRCRSCSTAPRSVPVHRCFPTRVGSTSEQRGHVHKRSMDKGGDHSSNKYIGNEGCPSCREGSFPSPEESESNPVLRQFYSSSICQETGRHKVRHSLPANLGALPSLCRPWSIDMCQTHTGQSQHPCRRPVPSEQASSDRVDTPSGDCRRPLSPLAISEGRSVRHQAEQSPSHLLLSTSGRRGPGSRQPYSLLGRAERICVSTPPSHPTSPEQDLDQPPGENNSHRTLLAKSGLVPSLAGAPDRSPQESSYLEAPPVAPPGEMLPPEPWIFQVSRLELIQLHLHQRGFSDIAVKRMSAPQRGSTLDVYQGKWSTFTSWCRENGVNPISPSIYRLVDFLIELFTERQLSVTAIKGYKSAIASTLRVLSTWDLRWEDQITPLFRGMLLERPRPVHNTPKWDLSVVLKVLMRHPFEPMSISSMKYLTLKTVFLVALATAQRRSELHALSFKKLAFREGGEVILAFIPGFLAKNQGPAASRPPVTIPSLSGTISYDLPDRTLCPVRALKFYINRTKPPGIRQGRERLFLSYKEGNKREIAAATISRWIVETIRLSYNTLKTSSDLRALANISAHEVRALATSWANYRGVALQEVVSAACWSNHSTFSRFYLRDVSSLVDGMHTIGPIVSAGHVV